PTPAISATARIGTRGVMAAASARRAGCARKVSPNGRPRDELRPVRQAAPRHHRDHHDDAAQEGNPALLDGRADAASHSGQRLIGPAFTLRFVPVREDLATPESWGKPISTRAAIEDMPEGCIAVADAMGVKTAGIFGDILVMRMARRGV